MLFLLFLIQLRFILLGNNYYYKFFVSVHFLLIINYFPKCNNMIVAIQQEINILKN
jgi:hypothetical protein